MTKSEILNTMKLLDIKEVTTPRQALNGTRKFKLPMRYYSEYDSRWNYDIVLSSFKSGYVRKTCYDREYQINKVKTGDRYYKLSNGDYRKFTEYNRVLIPNELDRLEYLLHYCIKNYYIGHANQVANGEFVPKWKYESYKDEYKNRVNEVNNPEVSVIVNGHRYNL